MDFLIIFLCATLLVWGDKKPVTVASIAGSESYDGKDKRLKKVGGGSKRANSPLTSLLLMVLCMKAAYFFDREQSMNSRTDDTLLAIKDKVFALRWVACYVAMAQLAAFEIASFAWREGSIAGLG